MSDNEQNGQGLTSEDFEQSRELYLKLAICLKGAPYHIAASVLSGCLVNQIASAIIFDSGLDSPNDEVVKKAVDVMVDEICDKTKESALKTTIEAIALRRGLQ